MFIFELYDKVYDKVTGFTGTITERSESITYNPVYRVESKENVRYFDELRLLEIESKEFIRED